MILRDHLKDLENPETTITDNPRMCSEKDRQAILKRDNYTCRYCGAKNTKFHIDHVYPYSFKGLTIQANLVTACSMCNWKKHNKIGIWPKPVGYFEEKVIDYQIPYWALIFSGLSMWMLYSSIDTLLNYPDFIGWARVVGFLGMLFGLLGIKFIMKGK